MEDELDNSVENLRSSDEFIEFIVNTALPDGRKNAGDILQPLSQARATQFFNRFFEANISACAGVDDISVYH